MSAKPGLPAATPAEVQGLLEHASEAVLWLDSSGAVAYLNAAAERALGRPRRALMGRSLCAALPESASGGLADAYLRALRTQQAVELEFYPAPAGGWLEARVLPYGGGAALFFRDVTLRRAQEEALREADDRFRASFELAAVGIAHVAPDGGWLRVNRSLCAILGYSEAELLGLSFQAITHPDDLEKDLELVGRLAAGEIPTYALEKRYLRRDGGVVWANLTVSLVRGADDRPDYFISVIEDITERRRAEAGLRASEELFRGLSEASPVGIFRADLAGRVTYANARLQRIWGQGEAAMLGLGWADHVHPDDRPELLESWTAALAAGREYEREYRLRLPGGVLRWVLGRSAVLRDGAGRATGVVGTIEDITERRSSEAASARLAAIVATSTDAILSKTLEGVVTSWNASAERMFGYTAEEMVGQPILRLIPPERHAEEEMILARLRAGEAVEQYETVRVAKDGRRLEVLLAISPVRDPQGRIVGASKIVHDITARKRAEEALSLSEARLRTILDGLPMPVYLADAQGRLSDMNRRWVEYTGLSREQSLGPGVAAAFHPDDLPTAFAALTEALRQGSVCVYEFRLRRADGSYRWHLNRAEPLRDGAGVVTGWVGAAADIHDLKEAQERLSLAQERGKAGFFEWHLDKGVAYLSGLLRRIAPADPATGEIALAEWANVVHPEDNARVMALTQETFAARQTRIHYEFRVRTPEGELWLDTQAEVEYDTAGRPCRVVGINYDITARREAEEALRESERRFRETLEGVRSVGVTLDLEGRVTFANRFLLELTGWAEAEVLGRSWFELFIPEGLEVEWVFHEALARGEIFTHYENEILTRDGQRRLVAWDNTVLRDAEGRVAGTASIGRDITDERAAQAALRRSEEQFRELTENIREVFWLSDPHAGRLLYVSPAFETLWGRPVEALRSDSRLYLEAVHPDDRGRVEAEYPKQVRGEPYDVEYRVVRPDGSLRWVRDRAFPVWGERGEVVRVAGVAEDITAYKESEQRAALLAGVGDDLARLEEPAEVMRAVGERVGLHFGASRVYFARLDEEADTSEVLYDWSADGRASTVGVYRLGEGFTEAFLAELRTGRVLAVDDVRTHPVTRVHADLSLALGIGASLNAPYRAGGRLRFLLALSGPGARRWQEDESRLLAELAERVWLRLERAEAQAALRASEERYRRLAESQKRFVNDAAHELRAPLTAIQGNLELLTRFKAMRKPDREAALEEVSAEAARLGRLVADMLALARGDSGAGLRLAPVRLDVVLREAFEAARGLTQAHRLELAGLPALEVCGDPDRLKQLTLQLLENAVKYTPAGGRVGLELAAGGGWAELRVRDTGIGIPPEDLPRVFERFYRSDKARSRAVAGTGLGLPIAKWIVEAHGGEIWLESEVGEGTTAVVRLPLSA